MNTWRDGFEDLLETLRTAQAERSQRSSIKGGEPEWVAYELQVMTDRVNLLRSRRGLGPIATNEVRSKESLAAGHIDYTIKWAIGCADLVVRDDT